MSQALALILGSFAKNPVRLAPPLAGLSAPQGHFVFQDAVLWALEGRPRSRPDAPPQA